MGQGGDRRGLRHFASWPALTPYYPAGRLKSLPFPGQRRLPPTYGATALSIAPAAGLESLASIFWAIAQVHEQGLLGHPLTRFALLTGAAISGAEEFRSKPQISLADVFVARQILAGALTLHPA